MATTALTLDTFEETVLGGTLEPAAAAARPDMTAIRDLCRSWRLRSLDPLIDEAAGSS